MKYYADGIGAPLTPEQIQQCRAWVSDAITVVSSLGGGDEGQGIQSIQPDLHASLPKSPNPLTTHVIRRRGRPRSYVPPVMPFTEGQE